jgi:hypothetical protein
VAANGMLGRKAVFSELSGIDKCAAGIGNEHAWLIADVSSGLTTPSSATGGAGAAPAGGRKGGGGLPQVP